LKLEEDRKFSSKNLKKTKKFRLRRCYLITFHNFQGGTKSKMSFFGQKMPLTVPITRTKIFGTAPLQHPPFWASNGEQHPPWKILDPRLATCINIYKVAQAQQSHEFVIGSLFGTKQSCVGSNTILVPIGSSMLRLW